jgi:hypothetical protein
MVYLRRAEFVLLNLFIQVRFLYVHSMSNGIESGILGYLALAHSIGRTNRMTPNLFRTVAKSNIPFETPSIPNPLVAVEPKIVIEARCDRKSKVSCDVS